MKIEVTKNQSKEVKIQMSLTKKQVQVLQDALSFSAWQFVEWDPPSEADAQFLDDLHDKIRQHTGIEGEY